MLTRIIAKNFKPFGRQGVDIKLGRITVLIGENGTGKSSLLQCLSLLKQSIGHEELRKGDFSFSSYGDLVHMGEAKRNIGLSLFGTMPLEGQPDYMVPFSYELEFADPGQPVVQISSLSNVIRLLDTQENEIKGEYKYGDSKVTPSRVGTDEAHATLEASRTICRPIVTKLGGYSSGAEGEAAYSKLKQRLNLLFSVFINAVYNVYIEDALRGFSRQSYPLEAVASEAPKRAEEVSSTFAYRREYEQKVSHWLKEITGTGLAVHLVPGRQVILKDTDGFDIYQGGFGTNQLIRPLLALAIASPESVVAIEEAETSLHPRAQVKLCDVLARVAIEENKQILLTTHNEHMLTGFLNLIAENVLSPQDLSIYFFEKLRDEAKASLLKADERGAVDGGLRGFFEVNLESYERHLKALSHQTQR